MRLVIFVLDCSPFIWVLSAVTRRRKHVGIRAALWRTWLQKNHLRNPYIFITNHGCWLGAGKDTEIWPQCSCSWKIISGGVFQKIRTHIKKFMCCKWILMRATTTYKYVSRNAKIIRAHSSNSAWQIFPFVELNWWINKYHMLFSPDLDFLKKLAGSRMLDGAVGEIPKVYILR